jgi:AcrR family transcriptional regulator
MATEKRPSTGEAIRDFVVDKVAEKVAEKAAKHEQYAAKAAKKAQAYDRAAGKVANKAARHAEMAEKAAKKAKAFERAAQELSALDLWTRPSPATRRPRFTRDEIAQTAIRIADAEGFAAVSMRRIAAELESGTMTLYHYVRTKDELLSLIVDAVMSEVVLPHGMAMPARWRDALTLVASRTRASLEKHDWIFDIADDPPLGPNFVRHFDQSLQAVASLDLPLTEKFDIVTAVDEYVFGYCLQHRNNQSAHAERSFDDDTFAYVERLVESGDYPQLEAMTREYGLEEGWRLIDKHMRDPQRFTRNLDRLLDGIEAEMNRR